MLGLHGSPTDLSTPNLTTKKGVGGQCERMIVFHHQPTSALPTPYTASPPGCIRHPSPPVQPITNCNRKDSTSASLTQVFDAIADKEIQDREEEQLGYLQEEVNEIRKLIEDIKNRQAETRNMVDAFKGADYDLDAVFERARNWRHARDDWSREYTPTPPPLLQSNLGASEKSFLEEMAEAEALETVQEEEEGVEEEEKVEAEENGVTEEAVEEAVAEETATAEEEDAAAGETENKEES